MKKMLLYILFFSLWTSSFAQNNTIVSPLQKHQYESLIYSIDSNYYPSITSFQDVEYSNLLSDKNALISYNKPNYLIETSPIFEIGGGIDIGEKRFLSRNALGITSSFSSDKFKFKLNYSYHIASLPNYLDSVYHQQKVIPSIAIPNEIKNNLYAFHNLNFMFSYKIKDYFKAEIGHGEHFFGDGYRSLLLSDNASNYPYLKLQTDISKKIRYVNLYGKLTDVRESIDKGYFSHNQKYFASHYITWNATKRLKLSFFEAVVWETEDSLRKRGIELYYLNPVILYRPVEFALGSPDNVLMGLNASMTIGKNNVLYAQLLLDEFYLNEIRAGISHILHPNDSTINYGAWVNKQAVQFGIKSYQVFGIKNSFARAEFNMIRPYTYSHRQIKQNYAHHNQSLAHPWNSNIYEFIFQFNYYSKRWSVENTFMYSLVGIDKDSSTHVGQNIYQLTWDSPVNNSVSVNYYGNEIGQGSQQYILFNKTTFNYLLIPDYNVFISCGYIYRKQLSRESSLNTSYFFLRISSGISDWFTNM